MSRIQLYIESIRFECPECEKENITTDSRPIKCQHCKVDLSYDKVQETWQY